MTSPEARPLVMGVLNVTPDSFFDGGRFLDHQAAVAHGRAMFEAGADVVDVGGESSRPGAEEVGEAEERRRVLPVLEALRPFGRLSVDTTKESVAHGAVDAGASLINDVGGTLYQVAASRGVGWVAMHRRGGPKTMQGLARYRDVVAEVTASLVGLVASARRAGVEELWVDPGIGFAKTASHNLALLRHLSTVVEAARSWRCRVLVGTSRKSFLGAVAAPEGSAALGVDDRLEPSLATALWAMVQGAAMVRVHDVAATLQGARLVGGVAREVAG